MGPNSRMKILFFIESLHRGGKERRAVELLHYLLDNTSVEILLVLTEPEIYYKSVLDLPVEVVILKRGEIKYDISLFKEFHNICKKFKPDIIHAWGKMTTFYAVPAKLLFKIPLISNLVSDAEGRYKKLSFDPIFYQIDILVSDYIVSNSYAGLNAYKISDPKALVIPNGVRLERFQQNPGNQQIREELGIKSGPIITMVASFTRYKDYDLFIDVAKEFNKIHNNATFIGVGDGEDWQRIHDRVVNEKVSNVLLTGLKNDVESIVGISDIGILCTYSEGISNSVIEYMAMGKPVISTDLYGGSRELILDGETGFCVERKLSAVLEHINILLSDEDLRLSMGNKGRERIWSSFSVNKMGARYLDLYKNVLNNEQ